MLLFDDVDSYNEVIDKWLYLSMRIPSSRSEVVSTFTLGKVVYWITVSIRLSYFYVTDKLNLYWKDKTTVNKHPSFT